MWQIDPTQLRRNAVAVAASAYYLAGFRAADVPALLGEMGGRGAARLGRDTTTALRLLTAAPSAERSAVATRAVNLVREAARRERRALEVGETPVARFDAAIDGVAAQLDEQAAVARFAALAGAILGGPVAEAAESVSAGAGPVPILVDDVQGFLDRREKVSRPPSLHNLMLYEVLNFVDGERTFADIYRAVAAEADAAGDWYLRHRDTRRRDLRARGRRRSGHPEAEVMAAARRGCTDGTRSSSSASPRWCRARWSRASARWSSRSI